MQIAHVEERFTWRRSHSANILWVWLVGALLALSVLTTARAQTPLQPDAKEPPTAVFAGGCFWSVETDFERAPGVLDVVVGYTGGRTKNPTYKTYAVGGHREAVLVTYDPKEITYAGLVEFLIKHSNPTDRGGSFVDRGLGYTAAIYYANEEEKRIAEEVIAKIEAMKVFRSAITIPVLQRTTFWPAEDYHQDYHRKNPIGYGAYRSGCGRDEFIFKHWGTRADFLSLPGAFPSLELESKKEVDAAKKLLAPWADFEKPSDAALKKKLTKLQYLVTQEQGAERPFESALLKEKRDGIYVDVVSGEPLFSSRDKIDGGDGWPAFSKSIVPGAVKAFRVGTKLASYVEVRSPIAESYLGRLVEAAPGDDSKRYSIQGAALRFVPVDKMAEEGYGDFIAFTKPPSASKSSAAP